MTKRSKTHARIHVEAVDLRRGQSLGYLFRDTYRRFSRELLARIEPHGVGLGQWYFLRVLWEEDGLSQRELSARAGMGDNTTVSAMRSLEKLGAIHRTQDPADARRRLVYLTTKGRRLRATLLPLAEEVNALAAAGLEGEEVAELSRLIRLVQDALGSGAAD
jgi:DNA-binding MarR family transcriptional regulator